MLTKQRFLDQASWLQPDKSIGRHLANLILRAGAENASFVAGGAIGEITIDLKVKAILNGDGAGIRLEFEVPGTSEKMSIAMLDH